MLVERRGIEPRSAACGAAILSVELTPRIRPAASRSKADNNKPIDNVSTLCRHVLADGGAP